MSQPKPIPTDPACDSPLRVPRFSILHLVVWMVATIVMFCIYLATDIAYGRSQPEVGPWTTYLLKGVYSALFGAVLVGAGILVRFSRVATFKCLQPGHWLIINFAILGLIVMIFSPSWRGNPAEKTTYMFVSIAIYYMVMGLLFCFVAMQLNYARRWKTFFGFAAATSFLASASALPMIQPDILRSSPIMLLDYGLLLFGAAFVMSWLVTVAMFLAAVVIDLRKKCRRDWLHWLGISVIAIYPLFTVAWKIARRFALP